MVAVHELMGQVHNGCQQFVVHDEAAVQILMEFLDHLSE